ncbi:penicillin-binding transpeptidase domain-containing protein [Kitasatospora sp. NPDC085879]|uniref:penicillin-binding transpeptidase domain-containing protein n=1 Tax=Kitasatospora sp. NPDC085879 TaxID=3154769 RepID=UPI00341A684B
MHKGVKIGIGTVCVAMLAVGGYGAYNIASALTGDDKPKGPRTVVAGSPTEQQAAEAAKAFLAAWSKGDLEAAGAETDRPDTADAALVAFRTKLKPSAITLTAGGPTAAPAGAPSPQSANAAKAVMLSFSAKVEFAGSAKAWTYDGVLPMVKMSDGKAAVQWSSTVVHPHLGEGRTIDVKPVFAQAAQVTDRKGRSLAAFPSLTGLLDVFKQGTSGDPADAGSGVVISDDSGKAKPEQLFVITEPKPVPSLRLTLDAQLQQAAEEAVKEQSKGGAHKASLVAIEPSTGNVLAFANAPTGGQNRAFAGGTAPGSTMKVLTGAALLEAGVTPQTPIACPSNTTAGGQPVANDFPEAHPEYTFRQDFAQSCNTAFINAGNDRLKADSLPKIAKEVFGLGLVWHTGLPAFDTDIPVPSNINGALPEFIGQGKIRTNSLAMASVSATVQNGTFHQPVLVPGKSDIAKASRNLDPKVLSDLRSLMRAVVTEGTARTPMAGISDVYAKTGTAEVDGKETNAWFTAYRGNLAVAAEVEGGGHGAQAAAPAAAKLLRIGNG